MSGKRKRAENVVPTKPSKTRRSRVSPPSTSDEDDEQLKAIFQRHFEGQFKPLSDKRAAVGLSEEPDDDNTWTASEDSDSDSDSDWGGVEDAEEPGMIQVEVIEHNEARIQDTTASKKEVQEFLSGKVPKSSSVTSSTLARTKINDAQVGAAEEREEKLNLKHDLALQRLLKESHLLDPSSNDARSTSLDPTGKNRLRALDIRMQTLGAASSVYDGGKMPMSMHKGITAFRKGAEVKRRRNARENGIILEREKRDGKSLKEKKRDRGVGGPSVGKYQKGMLVLSKKDVRDIEGPKDDGKRGKHRGRR